MVDSMVPISIFVLCDICKHVLQMIQSGLGAYQKRMGEQNENVEQIEYPKEEVNIVKGGKKHPA